MKIGSQGKSLILALARYGYAVSTVSRVKAVKGQFDRLVTKARKNALQGRREIAAVLGDKNLANILVDRVALQSPRNSGLTRLIKIGRRKGDGALLARIEFVDQVNLSVVKKKTPKAKKPEVGSVSKSKSKERTENKGKSKSKTRKKI